jgi:hypothetical protein
MGFQPCGRIPFGRCPDLNFSAAILELQDHGAIYKIFHDAKRGSAECPQYFLVSSIARLPDEAFS